MMEFVYFSFMFLFGFVNLSTVPRPSVRGRKLVPEYDFSYDNAAARVKTLLDGTNGPRRWSQYYASCSSEYQSPIDIRNQWVNFGNNYTIFWNNIGPMKGELINNGHALQFLIPRNNKILTGVPGLPVDISFTMHDFHIHFGGKSEHKIEGLKHFGEIHFDHYNIEYPNYRAALRAGEPEGLVTVAVFLEVNGFPGFFSEFDLFILRQASRVLYPSAKGINATINLWDVLPNSANFYTYRGSTTTPPCVPNVRWIVSDTPIQISPATYYTLQLLRNIKGELISTHGNSRPAQSSSNKILESNIVKNTQNTKVHM